MVPMCIESIVDRHPTTRMPLGTAVSPVSPVKSRGMDKLWVEGYIWDSKWTMGDSFLDLMRKSGLRYMFFAFCPRILQHHSWIFMIRRVALATFKNFKTAAKVQHSHRKKVNTCKKQTQMIKHIRTNILWVWSSEKKKNNNCKHTVRQSRLDHRHSVSFGLVDSQHMASEVSHIVFEYGLYMCIWFKNICHKIWIRKHLSWRCLHILHTKFLPFSLVSFLFLTRDRSSAIPAQVATTRGRKDKKWSASSSDTCWRQRIFVERNSWIKWTTTTTATAATTITTTIP